MSKISTTKKMIEPINPKMSETLDSRNEFPFEPGKNVINNILNYSKALSVRKSKSGKLFGMVLN